jgi:thiamine biosynthesis lipoprotein
MFHRSLKKIITAFLIALLIISQTACTPQTQPQHGESNDSFGEDWLLNTYCYIQIPEKGREDLIRQTFALAREYENKLSRTIADSEIGQFNASTGGCVVSEETGKLLEDCKSAYEMSGGRLDVTIGAVSSLWDFSAEEPQVPEADAIAEGLTHVGSWDALRIGPEDGSAENRWEIIKDDPGIMLDLGAIAKGYIADRAAAFLYSEGVAQAVVNFGGNVVFVGEKPDGSAWSCGIEDPSEGQSEDLIQERAILGIVRVRPQGGTVSVVTSGTYERCFEQDGVLYHHVLDPHTGYPVETDLLSATVIGPASEMCDILSTTCLLLGSEKALQLINDMETFEAVLILQDGSILTSSGADFTAK